MDYNTYPKYQSTDQIWLPEIPLHWEMLGLTKAIESRVDYRGKTPEKVRTGIFLVTAKNIKNGIVDYSLSQEFVKEEDYSKIMGRGLPEVGDVLFTTEAPLGEVANIVDTNVALAQRIIKLRGIQGKLDNYYLKYWILNSNFQQHLHSYATGSTALGIKGAKLFYLRGVLPPIEEQTQIAKFLDYKTAQIGRLIEKKKALIEKLGEQRIAMITQAVTKGLNPDAPMKDSEVDWLGEVPDHWEVTKFKYQIGFQEGPGIMGADFRGSGVPLARIRNVQSQYVDLEGCNYLDPDKVETRWPHFRCQLGDLIISGSASTGLISEINSDSVGAIVYTGLIRLWAIGDIEKEFIRWFVSSNVFFSQIDRFKTGSTIQHFGPEHLNQMLISLPPKEEQRVICNHLENRLRQLDSMVAVNIKTIDKLNEYRTALITAAVTGKIDVRQVEIPKQGAA